jgi:hypothetical protein
MSIALGVVGALTIPLWIRDRDLSVLDTPATWPTFAWILATGIAVVFSANPSAGLRQLPEAFFPLLVALAAWHGASWIAGTRSTMVLLGSAGIAWLVSLLSYLARGVTYPVRARGPSGHYMTFAGQLELIVSVALGLALVTRGRWRQSAIVVASVGLLCLVVSFTRSAWLGMLVSAVTMLAFWRARWIVGLGLIVALLVAIAPVEYKARLASIADPRHETNVERTHMWTAGLRMFRDRPITGVGFGDFKQMYDRYRPPESKERAGHLHSVPIQVAAQMGILGLAALIFLLAGLFRCAGSGLRAMLRAARRAPETEQDPMRLSAGFRLGVLGALTAFVVSGGFEWNLGDEELLYPLYILAGLAWAARAWPPPRPTWVERARRTWHRVTRRWRRPSEPAVDPRS